MTRRSKEWHDGRNRLVARLESVHPQTLSNLSSSAVYILLLWLPLLILYPSVPSSSSCLLTCSRYHWWGSRCNLEVLHLCIAAMKWEKPHIKIGLRVRLHVSVLINHTWSWLLGYWGWQSHYCELSVKWSIPDILPRCEVINKYTHLPHQLILQAS